MAAGLISCTPTLESAKISEQILAKLQQKDLPVKTVTCPQNVLVPPYAQGNLAAEDALPAPSEASGADVSTTDASGEAATAELNNSQPKPSTDSDATKTPTGEAFPEPVPLVGSLTRPFVCTGELDPEGSFPILVARATQQGQVQWGVPTSKGVLNLEELANQIQEAIAKKTKAQATLDCGLGYRLNQPGESFECTVSNSPTLEDKDLQLTLLSVRVSTDTEGNVSWQQVRQEAVAAAPPAIDGSTPTASGNGTSEPTFNNAPFTNPAEPSQTSYPEIGPQGSSQTSYPEVGPQDSSQTSYPEIGPQSP